MNTDASPKGPPKPKWTHPLERFVGQRVVMTAHGGTIIEGDLREVRDGTAFLEGAALIGTKHRAIVGPLLVFLHHTLSHVHPATVILEPAGDAE